MKKIIILLSILFISCTEGTITSLKPIENYKGCVLVKRFPNSGSGEIDDRVILKCHDSIIYERFLEYDLNRYKEKDTIK